MRCITYAGDTVYTTDDVASVLVELTAELANRGKAEAVQIPIVPDNHDAAGADTAELVIGVGNDVLSVPTSFDGIEPDFSTAAARLQSLLDRLRPTGTALTITDPHDDDYSVNGYNDYFDDYPAIPTGDNLDHPGKH